RWRPPGRARRCSGPPSPRYARRPTCPRCCSAGGRPSSPGAGSPEAAPTRPVLAAARPPWAPRPRAPPVRRERPASSARASPLPRLRPWSRGARDGRPGCRPGGTAWRRRALGSGAMRLDLTQDVGALTARLVDIESVSGAEEELADAIEEALRSLGHLRVLRDGNSVVARTELGRAERVVIAGHIDTVPVAGNLPSRLEGDLLYGCGAADMKSGLAVQLKLCLLTEPNRDLTFVFYDCEEVEAERNGLLRLTRRHPDWITGDFAVVMEPTDGEIEGGCQGSLRVEIVVPGARAHSARSWEGVNAIHAAEPILRILNEYEPRRPVVDGLQFREGLNAVGIRGGVAGNVIPDECVVTVNYRFAPDRTLEEAFGHVKELFG